MRCRDLGEWAGEDEEDENQYVIDDDEDLPHACFICREAFRDPVVTLCGHYFCQQCALEHNKTDPRCAACEERTNGVFNFAKKLFEKLKKDEARKKAAAAKAVEDGGRGQGQEEEGEEEEEDGLKIHETDRESVKTKQKKGAWSTV